MSNLKTYSGYSYGNTYYVKASSLVHAFNLLTRRAREHIGKYKFTGIKLHEGDKNTLILTGNEITLQDILRYK